MTVSRALKNPERLTPETLKKVMDAVRKTGYVPNLAAGSLRTSKTYLIAVFVPALAGLFAEMIQALTNTFAANNYQVMLGQVGYEPSKEAEYLRAVIGRRPDAIVLTGVVHTPEARALLVNSGIPVVETWDMTPTPIDMLVGFSHEEHSAEVCKFLTAKGRKHLAVVSGEDPRSIRRNEAFLKTAKRLGIQRPIIKMVPSPTNHTRGRTTLTELLIERPEIDAIYCSNDMLAMGVLTEAHVRGIDIPNQLSIMGTGDLDFAVSLNPSLTTVQINGALVGSTAAQFIIDRLAGKEPNSKVVKLGFSIIERQST